MLRKTISGFLALAMLLSLCFQLTAGAETFVKEWEFDGAVSGFGGNNSTLSSVNGKLVQTVTTAKNNTWLLSPNNLGVDATVYKYLKMSVKNDTTAAGLLAFEATGTEKSTFSGTFTALGTVPNDGEFHDYIIDLSEYSDWAGTISRFRLRLTAWNCEGTVEVDYIKLSDVGVPPVYGISINSLNAVSDKPMGQSISLTAAAVDGTPDSVEYFANGVSVGSANAAPYTVSWTPQQTGGYHVTATADFGGTSVSSEPVYVHVYDSTLIENSACYWQFANSTQSFAGNNSTLTSENGCLVQTVEVGKNNSFLVSPSGLGIDADSYKYIKLRVAGEYTKNGSLAVQWITESDSSWDASWADANAKTLNLGSDIVPCDGKFYDYTIDLSDNAGWSGTVTRLRIKVTPWNDTEEMTAHIDYIRVSDTAGDGIDVTEATFGVSSMFGSGCVIQRDTPFEVWGKSRPGERVTVTIGGANTTAITDDNGDWTAQLPALNVAGAPYEMTVSSERGETVSYDNILAGDVWVCSGQSNMQWSVQQVNGAAENIANAASYPNIRIFKQTKSFAAEPLYEPLDAQWCVCDSDSVKTCSAIGYNFAKEINESEKVPIGILNASYGGQMIERFIENSAIANGEYPSRATSIDYPSGIYNSMIAPLTRYKIKGVLWYQGESDSTSAGNRERYPYFQQLLLNTWESAWGFEQGTMPFLFAQLAGYGELDFKEIREIQHRFALANPNTAMAVLIDCGEENNLHPKDKATPAHRLALAALNKVYGHTDVQYKYPYAVDFKGFGNTVTVTFADVYNGLKCGGEIAGFKLCGADGVFYDADAVITSENTITVACDNVSAPTGIRYGYEAFPKPAVNLYNSADIPACPFSAPVQRDNIAIIEKNASGNVIAKVNSQNAINADAILASYDNAGRLLGVSFNTISGTYGECGLGAGASENAASARVYVWDNMTPVLTFDAVGFN